MLSMWEPHLLTVNQRRRRVDDSEYCLELFQWNKRLFVPICNNGWNLDPPLHARVKLAVSWVDSSLWTSPKVAKSTADSWQGYGISILDYVVCCSSSTLIMTEWSIVITTWLNWIDWTRKFRRNGTICNEKSDLLSGQCTMSQVVGCDGKISPITQPLVFSRNLFYRFGN